MAGKLSGSANIVRVVFIIFNVLFTIAGAIVLALGIYMAVEGESSSFFTESEVTAGASLLIAAGAVTFCIAAVGFIGACFNLRLLLVVYAIVLIPIILLEISAAIVGAVNLSQTSSDLEDDYTDSWQNAITDYRANPDSDGYQEDVNDDVDSRQEGYECCGATEPSDWGTYNPYVLDDLNQMLPDSCDCTPGDDVTNCSTVMFSYYNKDTNMTHVIDQVAWTVGCVDATIDWTKALFVIAAGAGFVVGILQISGVIIALSLVGCITNSLKKEIS